MMGGRGAGEPRPIGDQHARRGGGRRPHRRWGAAVSLALVCVVLLTGCLQTDVEDLAADGLNGRTGAGAASARDVILSSLRQWTVGPVTGASGDAAYLVDGGLAGVSVVGILPGTDLANEYVVVGAHYDGLASCTGSGGTDSICNGATDNATGVAVVLDILRSYGEGGVAPRRSIVFAFWDKAETINSFWGAFTGSNYWSNNPLVPLAQTVAYVNVDIQGSNLRPGAASSTFAIGAETGGPMLSGAVDAAAAPGALDTDQLSLVFGLDQSDHVPFYKKSVPIVFLTDLWGPCRHHVDDEVGVVDFAKLGLQALTARRLVADLATRNDKPAFAATRPVATYQDAVTVQTLFHRIDGDLASLPAAQRTTFVNAMATVDGLVAGGAAAFDSADATALVKAVGPVGGSIIPSGPCDGFLPAP